MKDRVAVFTGTMGARHDEESMKRKAHACPMNRIADPSELAEAVLFLASDLASFVTDHPLLADGGFMA